MTQHLIFHEHDRVRALDALRSKPIGKHGLVLSFRDGKHTDAQRRTFFKMMHEWAETQELRGQKWDVDSWRAIIMNAMGNEEPMLPQLTGNRFFSKGYSIRKMGVGEMSELLEFTIAESAPRGMLFEWLTENDK